MLDSNIWSHLNDWKQMIGTKKNYSFKIIWNHLTMRKQ